MGFFLSGETAERLQFNDNLAKANQIRIVAVSQALPLVLNVDRLFRLKGNASSGQLELHRFLIHTLEKARTKHALHFHSRADNGIHFILQNRFGHFHPTFFSTKEVLRAPSRAFADHRR